MNSPRQAGVSLFANLALQWCMSNQQEIYGYSTHHHRDQHRRNDPDCGRPDQRGGRIHLPPQQGWLGVQHHRLLI